MAALDWASSSSAAPTSVPRSIDVFLSFRGKDIRNNFISFLHKALKDRGINVFVDSDKRWVGETIASTLRKAIEGSKISIPVFSKGYADSKWCLEELALIVQCHRSNGQLILPIFYDVDPSHVRHQKGSFKEAFCKHEEEFNPNIVKEWRDALETVGRLIGEVVDETKNQAELIELVVKKVSGELIIKTPLDICEYPIGIDSQVNYLMSLLNIESNDVQFMGIYGFGGIGKTTIAKAVYNDLLSTFDKHNFLSDVRDQANQWLGLVSLQKRLLKDILKTDIDCANVDRGKKLIEQRLCNEKVLIVLDDVDSKEQVYALAGKHTWFGKGSRIIITTRDDHILNVAKVNKKYKPRVLDLEKSLQLFSYHAFQKDQPPEDYMQLSRDVAHYSGGLPLTLKVLGSYLLDISDKEEWKSTLQKLKQIPNDEIQTRLKISYDNLKDDYQKTIFLDAACFFIGWEKETVMSIWEACDCYPKSTILSLIRRSLLNFEYDWKGKYTLRMHDQIRDMGREIVRIENPLEPGKRSRLWYYGDILDVLKEQKGTGMIIGMRLPSGLSNPYLISEHLQMIPNLRFLDIGIRGFVRDFSHLPSGLRCFKWKIYRWEIIPTNCSHDRLVYLDISRSEIKQAWNVRPQDENKCFEKLKVLNLNRCSDLFESPIFSWFPYLEQLDLGRCKSLEMLDESIGQLSELKYLNLEHCVSLNELPDGVGLLEKLEVLNVEGCNRLKKLPRSMERMRCLQNIYLQGTNILKIPDDFSSLKNLKELNLCQCNQLKELSELPSSLVELYCDSCYSLVRLPDLSRLKILSKLKLKNCIQLEKIQGLEGTESLKELDASGCYKLTRTRRMKLGQGTVLPDRLPVRGYSFTAADGIYANSTGLILCIVFRHDSRRILNIRTVDLRISACVYQKGKTISYLHELEIEGYEFTTLRDTIYIHYFKGFDWFGIPLQGKDAIEILDIKGLQDSLTVKFWKLLYENKEPDQQMPNQYSDASPSGNNMEEIELSDFFDLSCVYKASPSGNSEEEEPDFFDCSRVYKPSPSGYTEDEISLGLSLTCWSPVEVEGSNSVPTEKVFCSKILDDENVDALSPSLSLALTLPCPCAVMSLDDGSNQQTQVDQLSHVQENGKTPPPSPSHHTEEEDLERNNTMKLLLSCLGFDSVSDGVEKEGEMLRPSKRARLHDNNDEATGPSLSLTLSTSSEMKSNNGFNLQQMLSQPPNIDDDDEAAGRSLSLALINSDLPSPNQGNSGFLDSDDDFNCYTDLPSSNQGNSGFLDSNDDFNCYTDLPSPNQGDLGFFDSDDDFNWLTDLLSPKSWTSGEPGFF